jgi:hypothetical protein
MPERRDDVAKDKRNRDISKENMQPRERGEKYAAGVPVTASKIRVAYNAE